MILINNPDKSVWVELLKRPMMNTESLHETVRSILNQIKNEGDEAVLRYEETFDHVRLESLVVTEEEIQEAEPLVSDELKKAILLAKSNIVRFHEAQRFGGVQVETQPGVACWQQSVPIERVGLYIPGGTAPLFSTVLMLAVPAQIAGCREIVLCTPPARNGKVHPAVLFAAKTAGVSHIYKIGGVQAIGAMAYGTQTVQQVYKIFGPGNQYVTAAKQLVSMGDVAIDMPAGHHRHRVAGFCDAGKICADGFCEFIELAEGYALFGILEHHLICITGCGIIEPFENRSLHSSAPFTITVRPKSSVNRTFP